MQQTKQPARLALAALTAGLLLAAARSDAQNPFMGLWVGNVTLDAVSDANPLISDLSFDLGVNGLVVETTLVPLGADWKYRDTGDDLGIAWQDFDYDDSAWSSGPAELGYGDGDEATAVNFGNPTSKYVTTYFRRTFPLSNPNDFASIKFRIKFDDAVVVYLNGAPILRGNLPSIYSYDTLASAAVNGTNEAGYATVTVPGNLLTTNNIVAVEIHQYSRTDDDISFDLEAIGTEVTTTSETLLPIHSTWKYDEGAADLGTGWRDTGYDDSAWNSGAGQLGYGDGDEGTVIGYGSLTNKNPTVYFRNQVVVTNAAALSHLNLLFTRDDGLVIYVNGQEVLRSNMPEGPINYLTAPLTAIGSADEQTYISAQVPATALVDGVNVIAAEVHQHPNERGQINVGTPTPTASPLELRLLLHVDSNGVTRLLKEVTQMWKDGTMASTPQGNVQTEAGHFVLVTDDTLLPQFKGVGLRDGELVGRRMSSIGFDFDALQLVMAGAFGPSGSLSVSNTLDPNFRTNPFRHKFHPDHDNLNAQYTAYQAEGPTVTRAITLSLSTRYPANPRLPTATPPTGWGESQIGGIYSEVLTGLHKNPIQVTGSFELQRISVTGVLNDGQ